MKRVFALLTAVMLIALIPMAALAATYDIPVLSELYETTNAKKDEFIGNGSYTPDSVTASSESSTKVSASDYEKYITEDGVQYELIGVNTTLTFDPKSTVVIPPIPELPEDYDKWLENYSGIYLAYGPHRHYSRIWFHSLTNHWQYCDGCGEKFNMDWHHDYTDTGSCYECKNPIHYYTITVKEMTGGTVTLSQEKGALNDRINVTVTPNEGYKLQEIRFYNLNEMHSQLIRYEDVPGSEYHFIILPWDIEIEADFVPVQ